ncbi:putative bifunctional diguanylate cyclase/phosphodiesterase [Conexibacter woesei]|uniref:putative bifunctional diguanylate cyclase/phosphodiesterase n=1 Tax=Conexibacter woesei TaxID=191495 RepID=UPI00040D3C45|nr:bifunctional diguanylate cyclase/phosphodiesterase [Conexibacter woesei]
MLVPPDGRGTGRTRDWLPTGGTLPAAAFETRHRTVVILLWIHVLGLPLFAIARGYPWYHGLLDTSPILVCAIAAMSRRFNRRGRASIGALGLVTCSAIFTHLWGGVTEAHFHFFVVVALLSLYEDWVPWGLAIAYVLVHHGVMGAIDPRSVFGDNPSAQAHPWRWAGIHAGFIGALAIVNIVSWRSNEKARIGQTAARRALAHRATHDPLTGLPNRPAFVGQVERALDRRRDDAHAQGRVAVMFVDIDDFKLVNDSLGHGAGDRLLEAVAQRLTEALRPQDVVARFGGDEFTVLVADVIDEADARRVAERLAAALVPPIDLDGESRFVTASVGLAIGGDGYGDADQLLQDADAAMYRAKANGKARCDTFDDSLRADAIRRLALESGLREALAHDELTLHYQPQVRLPDGLITGAEALIRWQHPDLGAVSPAEFIPMAERLGVIEEIGAWVVRTACAEAVAWGRDDLEIAVNVSPRQLSTPEFADIVRDALARSGLDAHRLCLEVTETALLADVEAAHAMLARLRELGVLLAVDDFGVGHASLRHLRQLLPVDVLKIDKSFVDGLAEDREDAAIISAVVRLAEGLGLDCIAEGVETAEQAEALSAMGCSNAQGWHFARPMPAEAIRAMLRPDAEAPAAAVTRAHA